MTDKISKHPLKIRTKKRIKDVFSVKTACACAKSVLAKSTLTKRTLAALLCTSVLAQTANAAQQEWWFDVEVILFERHLNPANISEKFKQSRLKQPKSDLVDLLTAYLKPDLSYLQAGLPYCLTSNQLAVQTQYKVATTDIFAPSDDPISVDKTTDDEDISPFQSELDRSGDFVQKTDIALAVETSSTRPPIQVELIEWQIPSEYPCVYAEQIDPSFASITALQNSRSSAQFNHQIKRAPDMINGIEWQQKRSAFLLPTSSMHMRALYAKIKRQRNITPILHLNWRQEVKFGRDKSQTFRLFAGENFAETFDAQGLPLVEDTDGLFASLTPLTDEFYLPKQELEGLSPEQQQALFARMNDSETEVVADDLFARIDSALADDTPININQIESQTDQPTTHTDLATLKEIWQLDGGITIYLRNVGRVPYLHIDSDLDFRQPTYDPNRAHRIEDLSKDLSEQSAIAASSLQPSSIQPSSIQPNYLQSDSLQPNFLQSVNFNQLRRVISKQVHYFDHPLFGMVVRINRFHWPEIKSDDVESVAPDN